MICKMTEKTSDNGVVAYWRNGNKHATTISYHRGGCLYAGAIILKCLKTIQIKEIDSTMNWEDTNVGDQSSYLESLWNKHLG